MHQQESSDGCFTSILVLIFTFFAAIPIQVMLSAWVAQKLWTWYAVDMLALERIGVVPFAGFILVFRLFASPTTAYKDTDEEIKKKGLTAVFLGRNLVYFLYPPIFLLTGWLILLFSGSL